MTRLIEVADGWYDGDGEPAAVLRDPWPGGRFDPARLRDFLRSHLLDRETYLETIRLRWDPGATDPLADIDPLGVAALTCFAIPGGVESALCLRRQGEGAQSVDIGMLPGRLVAFRPRIWRMRMRGEPVRPGIDAGWAEIHRFGQKKDQ